MKEATYYEQHAAGLQCRLCPKRCVIDEGKTGFCRVRKNIGGRLYAQNYAACTSMALDPIEKKPLYHFYPGSVILSLGTWGCNFSCRFCQNWQIAQGSPEFRELVPEEAAKLALAYQPQGNVGIAYTYSEPSVWFEYVLDTAKEIHKLGLKNVLVTNGFLAQQPLAELLPHIDGMNIDVKAFTEEYYKQQCAGSLDAVKETVKLAAAHCHVELTTLLVPGLNDREEELRALAEWVASLSRDIPLHLSRYFPNYQMDKPPTSIKTMALAYNTARNYLNYVYMGNLGGEGTQTFCPGCGNCIVDRQQQTMHMTENKKCVYCGYPIAIYGEAN